MKFRVLHKTIYEYAEAVTVSHHAARLVPLSSPNQIREKFSLSILPEPAVRKTRTDYFGNQVCFFSIQEIHRQLEVSATSVVAVSARPAPNLRDSPPWDRVASLFRDPVSPSITDVYQFSFNSPMLTNSPVLAEYARSSFGAGTPWLVGVQDLNQRIHRDFKYDPVATNVATPLKEVFEKRRGVCQDFAHVAIASLRSIGLPARYVSGYLRTRPPEGEPRLVGADASHAWFSVYCPEMGWVDFDPTNSLIPAEEHIRVAFGRDYGDVSPVSGIITGGGEHQVRVSVDVEAEEPEDAER
jgi:transglutaminase-like putative cysteine protease